MVAATGLPLRRANTEIPRSDQTELFRTEYNIACRFHCLMSQDKFFPLARPRLKPDLLRRRQYLRNRPTMYLGNPYRDRLVPTQAPALLQT
jgi:hypothetical protein